MKLTKQQEAEVMPIYKEWWHSYMNGDVKTYDHYLDDDYRFVGSTEAEDFLNKRDTTQFFDATADQLAGKSQLRNSRLTAEYYDGVVFITELADAYLLFGDDWTFYGKFRFSSMLRKNSDGWRFIYQHFSVPDSKAQEGETIGLEQVSKENQELRDAIKRRTAELENKNRDLEIEAALERVRARSSAMQYADELGEVIALIFNILDEFDISVKDGVALITFNEGSKDLNEWMANPGFGTAMNFHLPYFDHPVLSNLWDAKNRGDDMLIERYSAEESRSFLNHIFEHSDFKHTPQPVKEYCLAAGTYATSIALQKHTAIFINDYSGISLTPSEVDLLKRFSAVFEQTYTRFRDLQKAEAQARESQIEASLERVRSRAMAMHKSEELTEAGELLYKELTKLGIENLTIGYVLFNENATIGYSHGVNPMTGRIRHLPVGIPHNETWVMKSIVASWKKKEPLLVLELDPKETIAHQTFIAERSSNFPISVEQLLSLSPERLKIHVFNFFQGYLLIVGGTLLTEAQQEMVTRFAKVFEQTYTRFLDLQKAEEQAREAKIEAALERVRSISLAMHHTDELQSVIHSVHQELLKLKLSISGGSFIAINSEIDTEIHCWGSGGTADTSNEVHIPHYDKPFYTHLLKGIKKGPGFFTEEYTQEDKIEFFKFLFQYEPWSKLSAKEKKKTLSAPGGYTRSCTVSKHTSIFIINHFGEKFSEADNDILKRFGKVFEQSYTRFLDLQKAEAQAREAQIEAALERVRSRSLAMHKTDELQEVVRVVAEELKNTGVILDTWGAVICTYFQDSKDVLHWTASEDAANPSIAFLLPYFKDELYDEAWASKNRGDSYFAKVFSFDVKNAFFKHAFEHSDYRKLPDDYKKLILESENHGIAWAWSKNSAIMIPSIQGDLPSEDEKEILVRFARVFEQSFIRFLDLQKAEAQAREAQIELSLERIRSQVTAMQESSDLLDIVVTMRTEFVKLGHEAHYFWHMRWLPERYDKAMTSGDGTRIGMVMTLPRHIHGDIPLVADWEKSDKPTVVLAMEAETAVEYVHKMITLGDFEQVDPQAPTLDDIRHIGGLTFVMARTTHGEIGFSLPGAVTNPSKDAVDTLVRFAGVFDLAYKRFEDLKAAERQHREAQIELALERVRARTMAMQRSTELNEVASVLFEQIRNLGGTLWGTGFALCNVSECQDEFWFANEAGVMPPVKISNTEDDVHIAMLKGWTEKREYLLFQKEGDALASHYKYLNSLPQVKAFFEPMLDAGHQFPTWQQWHAAYFSQGYLLIITVEPYPEPEIFKRFAKVFDQTYTRFLDLKKAEAQAREAQIEASLERIRAKAMAMHHSDELDEVLAVLCEQFDTLGIFPMSTHMTVLDIEHNKFTFRETGKFGNRSFGEQTVALDAMDTWKDMVESWKSAEPYSINRLHFPNETLPQVWEVFHESFASMPEGSKITPDDYPDGIYHTAGKHPFGYIGMNQVRPATEKEEQIVIKFANEFGRAYQRFLDLQKAEEQAREAKIEAALEKVRSRTMGMQSSDELPEVANMLFLEVQELGIPAWSCGYCILTEDRRSSTCIMSSEGTVQKPFLLPHTGEASFQKWDDFVHSDEIFFTQELGGEEINSHYNFMKSLPQLKPVFQDLVDAGLSLPTYQINHLCKFSHGFLLFITYEEVPGSHDIFKRFTSVFEQTYTRFLDLKKSEQRAREAEVELSLERVRSQVTAMQTSSDLFDIVVNMRKEFISLGHTADYFWHMSWLPDSYEMSMTSEDGNRIGMVISLPKFVHEQIPGLIEWEKGNEAIYVLALDADEAWDYIENMNTHGHYEQVDPHAPTRDDIKSIGGLTFIIARTSHGEIGFSLPGEVPHPPQEALDTLVRFAGVFDLAYQRFEDLQESEQQARLILEERDRLEIALKELHATQDQLVQQEKLASLGQLTAGIAHEIKNPLNFVNNFSEVSIEMVEEAREEVRRETEDRGSESLILEILDDIEANLRKIHEHGSRADGIVKSMLQHSRGGDGKMEPSPLNPLVKEYVNLAFHGMRAGKEPIDVDIDLQLDENVGEVPLVAEDFSRVILNLCQNSFDAMRDKAKGRGQKAEEFTPKLTVRTKSDNGKVTIEIADNGPGISDEIKDKILQPFFTTKKGTQGTGLGLSITNDIVKAHGGRLEIESRIGEYTTFTVQLPLNTNDI